MGATGESVRRLTDFGFEPSWSPDGSEIVVATEGMRGSGPEGRLSKSQLWAVDVNSGERRLVIEGDAVQPSWSPHGERIAYWSIEDASGRRTGQRDIWTLPATGGEAVPVTEDAHVDWSPVWSSDGRYLYFSSNRGGSMNLWRIPFREETGDVLGPPEPVTTGAAAAAWYPSTSKDGGKIAHVARVRESDIWKVPFDPATGRVDGEPIAVTQDSREEDEQDVSPDGLWLAYRSIGRQEDIFIMRTDGTGRRQLTDDIHNDRGPRWSPDGGTIAFYSNRSGSYEIWTIRPDGSGLTQLTDSPGKSTRSPVWSPDGQWLVGIDRRSDGSSGIVLFALESRRYERLTNLGNSPRWTLDGRGVIFRSRGGRMLYRADIESGEVSELVSLLPDLVSSVSLSPDNRWIYFERIKDQADVWLLTLGVGDESQ